MPPPDMQHAALIALDSDILLHEEPEDLDQLETLPATAQRRYVLKSDTCQIGRNHITCQVVVRSKRTEVSRVHASISRQGMQYILEDSNSAHGTFVNGQRINSPHLLRTGDIIGLAGPQGMLRFEDPAQAEAPLQELLTERELEVLRQLAVGRANQEIAEKLVINVETVRTHLKRIYDKLGVENRTQAVHEARQRGLI